MTLILLYAYVRINTEVTDNKAKTLAILTLTCQDIAFFIIKAE